MTQAALLETDSNRYWPSMLRKGISDIAQGLRRHELWAFLGWREVRKQYQRSVLGPFWLTLNMGILVTALGWFYSHIFAQNITEFLPYLALGFIIWALISGMINDSCTVFTSAANSVRQAHLPFSIYAYQLAWRHLVVFGHNIFIYVGVAIFFRIWPGATALLAIPGIALILTAGFFLALVLGPMAARFRDIPPITASFTQILFFLTPIIWTPQSLPERAYFVMANPFYHFLAIVREPLLGRMPTALNWSVSLGVTVGLAAVAIVFFSRLRARIPYWA
ncbi:ABC transporter permease [Aureimonas frigidaquae]|uniref:ABC transporter permease n=1 Tax=Aureimonas frigidaquae TaxID=424757 RepID=UPI000AB4FABB|nr:ABC transporter permease [Aureimonas frigidaquae]